MAAVSPAARPSLFTLMVPMGTPFLIFLIIIFFSMPSHHEKVNDKHGSEADRQRPGASDADYCQKKDDNQRRQAPYDHPEQMPVHLLTPLIRPRLSQRGAVSPLADIGTGQQPGRTEAPPTAAPTKSQSTSRQSLPMR